MIRCLVKKTKEQTKTKQKNPEEGWIVYKGYLIFSPKVVDLIQACNLPLSEKWCNDKLCYISSFQKYFEKRLTLSGLDIFTLLALLIKE